jgi:hypothetical protein
LDNGKIGRVQQLSWRKNITKKLTPPCNYYSIK